jgi:hypothetical protein
MKLKVTIPAKEIEIERCYHTCPHFRLDGGPSPAMCCSHPYWDDKGPYAGFIISHPQCDAGFPDHCPLLKENGIINQPIKQVEKSNDDYLTKEELENLSFGEQIKLIFDRRVMEHFEKAMAAEKNAEI